jgi:hypothetical protein
MSATPDRPDPLAEPEGYGSKIGRIEHLTRKSALVGHKRAQEVGPPGVVPDGGLDDEQCAWYQADSGERCRKDRGWQVVAGDAAEHVCRLDLCEYHLQLVAAQPRFWCTACRMDMRLEKVGRIRDGELIWLDPEAWPGRLRVNKPPEKLF